MLNALVSSKQIRFKQMSQTVCTDGRVPDKIQQRVPNCVTVYMSRYDDGKCSEHLYVKFSSLAKN